MCKEIEIKNDEFEKWSRELEIENDEIEVKKGMHVLTCKVAMPLLAQRKVLMPPDNNNVNSTGKKFFNIFYFDAIKDLGKKCFD